MTTKLRTQDAGEERARQEMSRADLGAPARPGRRSFLRAALAGAAGPVFGAVLSGCSSSSQASPTLPTSPTSTTPPAPTTSPTSAPLVENTSANMGQTPAQPSSTSTGSGSGSKVLLVYFSRAGENYYYGGRTQLKVGNSEVLAGMINRLIGCDVHRIEPADPYPEDYEETRARNVQEQEANARPAIANPLASIEPYDTVLLGSPIWNVRAPMIMSTFVEGFDFTGKTVFPFTTYAVSGLGTTVRDYTASCPGATIGGGLAVQGEKVQDGDPNVGPAVESWLRRIGLLSG